MHASAIHLGLGLLAQSPGLALVLLIAVVAVVIVLAMSHHLLIVVVHFFHPHVMGLFIGLALMLFFVWGFAARVHNVPQANAVMVMPAFPQVNGPQAPVVRGPDILAAPVARMDLPDGGVMVADAGNGNQVKPRHKAGTERKPDRSDESPEKPTRSESEKTSTDSSSGTPPAWAHRPPHKDGDFYIMVVHLDADTNPAVRDDLLDEKMLVTANQYIDEHLYPDENVSKVVHLTGDYVHSKCRKATYPEDDYLTAGQEVFARLEFGRDFRDEIDRRYRAFLSAGHLQQLSEISLVALVLMGGLYAYLRSGAAKRSETEELEVPTSKA
jgi:hypothetical protein